MANEVMVVYKKPDDTIICKKRAWADFEELQEPYDYVAIRVFHDQTGQLPGGGTQTDINEVNFSGWDMISIRCLPHALRITTVNNSPKEAKEHYFYNDTPGTQNLAHALPDTLNQAAVFGVRLYTYAYNAPDYDQAVADALALDPATCTG